MLLIVIVGVTWFTCMGLLWTAGCLWTIFQHLCIVSILSLYHKFLDKIFFTVKLRYQSFLRIIHITSLFFVLPLWQYRDVEKLSKVALLSKFAPVDGFDKDQGDKDGHFTFSWHTWNRFKTNWAIVTKCETYRKSLNSNQEVKNTKNSIKMLL